MMASFSSSLSTAPESSRSSGRGALASMAAPVGARVSMCGEDVEVVVMVLTLLFGLVLLLVLCQEHVVGETAARDRTLQAHAVRLAC